MKRQLHYFFFLLNFFLVLGYAGGQNSMNSDKTFSKAIVEISAGSTVVDDYWDPVSGDYYPLFDNSINAAVLVSLFNSKHIKAGLQYNYLWTTFKKKKLDNYYMLGIVGRFDTSITRKWSLF